MSVAEVSRRYSRALYTSLKQTNKHTRGLEELRIVAGILNSDSSIQSFYKNPLVTAEQKAQVTRTAFSQKGLSEDVLGLLLLMAEKNRLNLINEVVSSYENLIDLEMGVTRGVVRAAKPLSVQDQKVLEEKMNQVLKKKIVLTYKEDPTLLGGVVAEVGGWTFDDSIETHLRRLNENLMKR